MASKIRIRNIIRCNWTYKERETVAQYLRVFEVHNIIVSMQSDTYLVNKRQNRTILDVLVHFVKRVRLVMLFLGIALGAIFATHIKYLRDLDLIRVRCRQSLWNIQWADIVKSILSRKFSILHEKRFVLNFQKKQVRVKFKSEFKRREHMWSLRQIGNVCGLVRDAHRDLFWSYPVGFLLKFARTKNRYRWKMDPLRDSTSSTRRMWDAWSFISG